MSSTTALITKFYTAFQQRDFKTMGECYHADATFKDEAFDSKTVAEIRSMWEMLCTRGKDLRVEFKDIKVTDEKGTAHWDAYYTFSKSGRKVHNSIEATFEFKDGLILNHRDHFNFYRWSKQALGISAVLLGWTRYFRKKVQAIAMEGLKQFMEKV
jgi:ketosteroid isomerase-like protein